MEKWILIEIPIDLANEIFFTESDQRFWRSDDLKVRRLQNAIGKKVYEEVVKVLEQLI